MAYDFSLLRVTDWQLLGLLVTSLSLFVVHFWRRGRISIADPAFLLLIVFGLGTAMKVIYLVFFRADGVTETLFLRRDRILMGKDPDFLVTGMIFVVLSVAAYLVGLQHRVALARIGTMMSRIDFDGRRLGGIAAILIVFTSAGLVWFLLRVDAFETGSFFAKRFNDLPGGSTSRFFVADYWVFKIVSSIKYVFYALLIYWIHRGERVSPLIYALMIASFALSVLVPAVFGNRAFAFLMCLDLAILFSISVSLRRAALFGSLVVVAVALIGVTTLNRYEETVGEVERQARTQEVIVEEKAAAEVENERRERRALRQRSDADRDPAAEDDTVEPELSEAEIFEAARAEQSLWLARRVGDAQARKLEIYMSGRYFLDLFRTSHIVDEIPRKLPHLMGESFVGWLFVLIPRSVWPDKPISVETAPILGKTIFLEPRNNVPPGLVGEAYWNFGWWLGIAAVGLVGAATGLLYNTFLASRSNAVVQVAFAIVVTRVTIIMFNTSFGESILKALIDTLPLALLLLVAMRFSHRPTAVAA